MTNLRALYAWVMIPRHVTGMLSLAEHWHGRWALSNHVCAHSVTSMWHMVCLQYLARACSEQSRSTSVLPMNHVIQMPQCLSGFVNHDYFLRKLLQSLYNIFHIIIFCLSICCNFIYSCSYTWRTCSHFYIVVFTLFWYYITSGALVPTEAIYHKGGSSK